MSPFFAASRDMVAAARDELDELTRDADCRGVSLQQAMADRWPPGDGGPQPAHELLALWSLGIVALYWAPPAGPRDVELAGLDLLHEVAARKWTEETVRVDGVPLSRMLMQARPPFTPIRAAARMAAGAIARIDGGVALVAHDEIA